MRAFILRLIIILGYLCLIIGAGWLALGIFGPSHPGSVIFPIQAFAEHEINGLYTDRTQNANYLLDMVVRRINDLSYRAGSKYELMTMEYLDKSIDRAALAIKNVPQEKSEALQSRFVLLAEQAQYAILQLKQVPREETAAYAALQAKLQTIQRMVSTSNVQINEPALVPAIESRTETNTTVRMKTINSARGLIPWPAGSPGAIHDFYPLTGQHETLTCVSCHNEDVYLGTPNQCIDCHFMKTPIPHYPGGCELCHTPVAWTDIHFDHIVVSTFACDACHEKDKPANHYNGPCSACHITQNWTTVTFDHAVAGAVDCISCHANVAPGNHYAGQCSNCHNTDNWTSVVFDHTGFTNCVGCHAAAAPANHYGGQCSYCHSTSGPWANAQFNHSGFTDCSGCHGSRAPANHYPGQCSNCHNTASWSGASFNHAGFTDCVSCHLKDRPSDHDQGQCSECHNTQRWGDGGDSVGLAVFTNNILQPITCSICHQAVTYNIGKEIKQ